MNDFDPVGGGFLVQKIVDFFSTPVNGGNFATIYKIILVFKVIFIFFLILFIIGIIYTINGLLKLRPDYKLVYNRDQISEKGFAKKKWKAILERFKSGSESDFRLAIIEADSLVDEVFKKIGFEGESLGDRIAGISQQEVHSIMELRDAHRLRNNLVHTPGYHVTKEDAERAIRHYENVLSELEVI